MFSFIKKKYEINKEIKYLEKLKNEELLNLKFDSKTHDFLINNNFELSTMIDCYFPYHNEYCHFFYKLKFEISDEYYQMIIKVNPHLNDKVNILTCAESNLSKIIYENSTQIEYFKINHENIIKDFLENTETNINIKLLTWIKLKNYYLCDYSKKRFKIMFTNYSDNEDTDSILLENNKVIATGTIEKLKEITNKIVSKGI